MHAFWFFVTTVGLVTTVLSKSCLEVKLGHERDCQARDSEDYVTCVKTRMKRQSSNCKYDDECSDCECEFCQYSQCDGNCNDCCNSCCTNYVQCHTNHCCHKQCHSECRNYNCRNSCRKSCYDTISRETNEKEINREVIERIYDRTLTGSSGSTNNNINNNLRYNTSNINTHNITTVINLKNVINNTNLIDVPINLNYTNKNNISLTEGSNFYGGPGGSSGPRPDRITEDNCCIIIGSKQCVPRQTSPYVECFYLRSRQCGSICTGNIMHKESYPSGCYVNNLGQTVCQSQNTYIPQPQPRCAYSNTWPYVTCPNQPPVSCEGCYGHYFNSQVKDYRSCSPQCYNDFGTGPLYRQGPFYQPTYSHLPPCYLSPQGCGGGGGGGFGGFGMMGAYGGGLGGFMGGLNQGFGGGYGYAGQLPISTGPFLQPQPIPFNPQLVGNFIYPTTDNQTMFNSSVLDAMVIDSYQADGRFEPRYDLSDQEVNIDVEITDPNKNKEFYLPFKKNMKKARKEMKEDNNSV